MKNEIVRVSLTFIFFMIFLPTYGETLECGPGTIVDNSTGQCIPQCGDGTIPNGENGCIEDTSLDLGQIEIIAGGIIVGVLATAFGIIWTIISRRAEKKKEDLEIIQNYGNQLSEIRQGEKNLETKLDCAVYAEKYMDTLDQIASLLDKKLIRRDVADYFENDFKYGMNLWFWYKENLEKIPEILLKDEFTHGLLEPFEWRKKNYKKGWEDYYEEKKGSEEDRWYYFRWWCNLENV